VSGTRAVRIACRRQRHGCDRLRNLDCLIHQARRRDHPRDEARALRFRRVHHAAREAKIHGLGFADGAGETLRPADARNDAELDLGLAEFRRVGRDDDVTHHGELAAAAEGKTRDRSDRGFARPRQRIPIGREVAHERIHVGFVRHLLDVGAGRERLLRTGDDHAGNAGVRLERRDRLSELRDQRGVERVERLRPVEANDPDLAAGLDDDVLIGHGLLPASRAAGRSGRGYF
jgi:hypothetical protein